ncbi:hypothetical protein BDDG_00759 [Blastomyces dermatitidis ATCC 18188]|uniref:Gag1-like clamp domain-containing protein n=1 Tax=Ajellomyces dermatitidis (strain ATCC 18188 / CBS 674.68) TaxID=653446 RepID=F2T4G3_AJEDA|nr:hypothetical protein BDDG_00759 [Blastomyces dermatitidis ATCC 18188]
MALSKSEESPSQPRASVFASLHRKPHPDPRGGTDGAAEKALETRVEAIKAAKRYLLETIRDDWSYEYQSATPPPKSDPNHVYVPLQPQSSIQCDTSDGGVQVHARQVREWREREQDSSCSESGGGFSPRTPCGRVFWKKRKRRKVVEEEAAWNEGLRIWIERRDAWTGAILRKPTAVSQRSGSILGATGSSEASGAGSCANEESEDVDMAPLEPSEKGDTSSQPLSSSGTDMQTAKARISSPPDSLGNKGINGAASPINTYTNPDFNPNHLRVPDSEEPLIPVVEPLLPITNPVRASIKPAIYPSIYSKVVIQSLTPAIPINLSDVTKALVQGWKADGEWPPKPTVTQDVSIVKKRLGGNKPPPTEDARKSRGLSGSSVTGAVKKVLGLSGINTGRRFHIRGGSHVGAGTSAGAGSPTASGVASNEVAETH